MPFSYFHMGNWWHIWQTQYVFAQSSLFCAKGMSKLLSRPKKCYFHSPLNFFWLTMTLQIENTRLTQYASYKKEQFESRISQWRLLQKNKKSIWIFENYQSWNRNRRLVLDFPWVLAACTLSSFLTQFQANQILQQGRCAHHFGQKMKIKN